MSGFDSDRSGMPGVLIAISLGLSAGPPVPVWNVQLIVPHDSSSSIWPFFSCLDFSVHMLLCTIGHIAHTKGLVSIFRYQGLRFD